jgi:hypothetical protein
LFSILELSIWTIWLTDCILLNLIYSLYQVCLKILRALHYVIVSILSYFHRLVHRFSSVFSFQILLAFFWWLSHLSLIHRDSLVLLRLESCIF